MVADDSAVVRGLISRMLNAEADMTVAASVGNGQLAVTQLARTEIDVIVLDIEMPVMDGLTALPKLKEIDPNVQVIMASTLTLRNAEISMRALEAGAADYVPKPTSSRELSGGEDFRRDLIEKVRSLARVGRSGRATERTPRRAISHRPMAAPRPAPEAAPIVLRDTPINRPDALVIGSSTGGPQALLNVLKGLGPPPRVPVFVTQHMPATFTAVLAEHITRSTSLTCAEAIDGERVVPGRVYLAPGGFHMVVERKGVSTVVRLDSGPQENFCRPAVDPMLRSIARVYGGRTLVVILTGMGADGLKGGREITAAGGTVIAQDESTSVVWGMPGSVASAGLCSAVLPVSHIAPYVNKIIGKVA
ncbi:MAG: chemotaxis response regulator protein-glutamate methylesterase [Rhodospirillales bacterium]|nr:chemotaxis response regulator protein-glutamate methylesterase [Rhodospirillales bacterium]